MIEVQDPNHFHGEEAKHLPFMFLVAEESNGDGERRMGMETDVLTNNQYSDTD